MELEQPTDPELVRFKKAQKEGKKTVLFVCTGNAVRSQMAEALVNHFLEDRWTAFSSGFMPMGIHPLVVAVLREIGIDASRQKTKHLDLFNHCEFDLVVTLCSDADKMCTFYPAYARRVHIPFQDPLTSASFGGGRKGLFRKLRDEIQQVIIPQLKEVRL